MENSSKKIPKIDIGENNSSEMNFPISIKSGDVIPLLVKTIGKILEHKNPNLITSNIIEVLQECLEQVILKEISIETIMKFNIGILIKEFYEFIQSCPQLAILNIITRCAFKKLKERVYKAAFGIKKSLYYESEESHHDEIERPKEDNSNMEDIKGIPDNQNGIKKSKTSKLINKDLPVLRNSVYNLRNSMKPNKSNQSANSKKKSSKPAKVKDKKSPKKNDYAEELVKLLKEVRLTHKYSRKI